MADGKAGSSVIRTHEAGTLRGRRGESAVLGGWVARRRDHGGAMFIDLRDASGVVQVNVRVAGGRRRGRGGVPPARGVLHPGDGRRTPAPGGEQNLGRLTGQIEVVAEDVEVLSEGDPLPFPVEGTPRRARMLVSGTATWTSGARNAELRARLTAAYLLNDVMRDHRVVNVETPYLTRSTPRARGTSSPRRAAPGNGTRRRSPGAVRAAPMVGGLERHDELAPGSATRTSAATGNWSSPRSTSTPRSGGARYATAAAEAIVGTLWQSPLLWTRCRCRSRGRRTRDAMSRFGSDKPDLRVGVEEDALSGRFAGNSSSGCSRRRTWALWPRAAARRRCGVSRRPAGLGRVPRCRAWHTR